jgi:hypothetical protein
VFFSLDRKECAGGRTFSQKARLAGAAGQACPAPDGSRLPEKIRKFNGLLHSRTKTSFSAGPEFLLIFSEGR